MLSPSLWLRKSTSVEVQFTGTCCCGWSQVLHPSMLLWQKCPELPTSTTLGQPTCASSSTACCSTNPATSPVVSKGAMAKCFPNASTASPLRFHIRRRASTTKASGTCTCVATTRTRTLSRTTRRLPFSGVLPTTYR